MQLSVKAYTQRSIIACIGTLGMHVALPHEALRCCMHAASMHASWRNRMPQCATACTIALSHAALRWILLLRALLRCIMHVASTHVLSRNRMPHCALQHAR